MILSSMKQLRIELSLFFSSLVISLAIFLFAQQGWQRALETRQLATQQLQTAKTRYQSAVSNKQRLDTYEGRFKQLASDGMLGKEQRLEWIDAIEASARQASIPYLKYTIDKQQTLNSAPLNRDFPGITLNVSQVQLDMQLLHEGSLLTLFDTLESKAHSLFDIQQCAITRNITNASRITRTGTDRNFSARCILHWYSIQDKQGAPVRTLSARSPK